MRYNTQYNNFSCYTEGTSTDPRVDIYKYYDSYIPEVNEPSDEENAKTYTAQYSGSTTQNMKSGQNNASLIGLDDTKFNVASDNQDNAVNHVGLNKSGQIRLYRDFEESKGTILTITAIDNTIAKITITFGSTQGAVSVKAGTTEVGNHDSGSVKNTSQVYEINSTSFSITNITPDATTQVYILSIVIELA